MSKFLSKSTSDENLEETSWSIILDENCDTFLRSKSVNVSTYLSTKKWSCATPFGVKIHYHVPRYRLPQVSPVIAICV